MKLVEESFAGYSREPRPLAAYATLVGVFSSSLALFFLLARLLGRPLPKRIGPMDLLLLGVATRQMSRLISKDAATSFLRAPFTEYVGPSPVPGEVVERPRGSGLRWVVGQLLTNPLSTGQWIAAGLVYGLLLAPRLTRLVAGIFATVAIADFLQGRGERSGS